MRISEVSRRTGVSIRSLRYYEQKRLLCPRRLENGYRDLDEEAVQRVKTIQMYLGLGLTTEQIEEILACTGTSPLPIGYQSVKRSYWLSIRTKSEMSNTRCCY